MNDYYTERARKALNCPETLAAVARAIEEAANARQTDELRERLNRARRERDNARGQLERLAVALGESVTAAANPPYLQQAAERLRAERDTLKRQLDSLRERHDAVLHDRARQDERLREAERERDEARAAINVGIREAIEMDLHAHKETRARLSAALALLREAMTDISEWIDRGESEHSEELLVRIAVLLEEKP